MSVWLGPVVLEGDRNLPPVVPITRQELLPSVISHVQSELLPVMADFHPKLNGSGYWS